MALHLGLALWAVAITLCLPGLFWQRVLVGAADRAEAVTLSIGLSVALLPPAALALEALFGPGVTLPVAVGSILVVLASGFAVFTLIGRRRDTSLNTPTLVAPRLGPLACAPLCAAATLMLGARVGLAPPGGTYRWVAALVLVAGAMSLLHHRRPSLDSAGYVRPAPGFVLRVVCGGWFQAVSLVSVLFLVLVRAYVGPVLHQWPYIGGGDLYDHAVMTNLVLAEGSAREFMTYPPGLHILTAVLCRVSGLPPLELYPYAAPALLLLPALASYVLARRQLGPVYGIPAAFFAGLVLHTPYRAIQWSMYADVLAGGFLLLLYVASLGSLLGAPSRRTATLAALLGSAIVMYHSISTLCLLLVLLPVVLLLPWLLWRDPRRGRPLLFSLALLAALSIAYAWTPYDLPRTAAALLGWSAPTDTGQFVQGIVGQQRPQPLLVYPAIMSAPVVWLGLLGFVLLLGAAINTRRLADAPGAALLLSWCALVYLASRTSLFGVPIRLASEVGVSLSLAAAFAFVTVLRSAAGRIRAVPIIAAALLTMVVAAQAYAGLVVASKPSSALIMTPGLATAGEFLRAANAGGNVITSPHVNAALLAMGGYSSLPSVTWRQLPNQRYLESRFRDEALDVLQVYAAPDSVESLEVLRAHDVRYVALHKRLRRGAAWGAWRGGDRGIVDPAPFRRRPDLYEPVFENEDVVVFGVRPQLEAAGLRSRRPLTDTAR